MQRPGSAGHSVSALQVRPTLVPMSQTGLAGSAQSVLATHSTQAPDEAQAGVALAPPSPPAQSLLPAQARHALVVLSQTGAVPLQEDVVHATLPSLPPPPPAPPPPPSTG